MTPAAAVVRGSGLKLEPQQPGTPLPPKPSSCGRGQEPPAETCAVLPGPGHSSRSVGLFQSSPHSGPQGGARQARSGMGAEQDRGESAAVTPTKPWAWSVGACGFSRLRLGLTSGEGVPGCPRRPSGK